MVERCYSKMEEFGLNTILIEFPRADHSFNYFDRNYAIQPSVWAMEKFM